MAWHLRDKNGFMGVFGFSVIVARQRGAEMHQAD
jgi:hypothetical protein